MKAYVAARTSDFERARQAQAQLRSVGYEITFDWTVRGFVEDSDVARVVGMAQELAERERAAVIRADLFVLLWKHDDTFDRIPIGKLIEFGIAVAFATGDRSLDKRVIVVGDPPESIFWHLRDVERVADLDGLARIVGFMEAA